VRPTSCQGWLLQGVVIEAGVREVADIHTAMHFQCSRERVLRWENREGDGRSGNIYAVARERFVHPGDIIVAGPMV